VPPGARGKRRGSSPGTAERHSLSGAIQGRAAAEGFSWELLKPSAVRAHWIGPELGCCILNTEHHYTISLIHNINTQYSLPEIVFIGTRFFF